MSDPRRTSDKREDKGIYRGALSGTKRIEVAVTGHRGRAFNASLFTQVNVGSDPNLRASVLDGSLNTVAEPVTGARFALATPVLYHDPRRRLFALLAPDSLRHRELELRREVLTQLDNAGEAVPGYVRGFAVAFGPRELENLEQEKDDSKSKPATQSADVKRLQRELAEREEALTAARQQLEALRLNLEDKKAQLEAREAALRKAGKLAEPPVDDEPTTVVPREVFFGPASGSTKRLKKGGESKTNGKPWSAGVEDGWDIGAGTVEARAKSTPPPLRKGPPAVPPEAKLDRSGPHARVKPSEIKVTDDLPRAFNRLKSGTRAYYHTDAANLPLLAYRLPEARLKTFVDGDLSLHLQFHDLDEYPLITLLVAVLDDEGLRMEDIYWPIDLEKKVDRRLIETLCKRFELRVGLYGDDLALRQVFEFREDLELNATHVLQLATSRLGGDKSLDFDAAIRRIENSDYERLGSMRHNFHKESFAALNSPSEARLAAGIVGYWSGPETFRYLIENRSFSLQWFAQIQERVARSAVRFGICVSPELRQVAVDIELADDDKTLVRDLAATWAQVSLGLGGVPNDLDELGEWENWQDIIDAYESLDMKLEEELAELASASLKRAQQFTEENDLLADLPETAPVGDSNAGEVTVIDQSGGLGDVSSDDLQEKLQDEDERLQAAISLLQREKADAVDAVLEAAEEMSDEELASLSEVLAMTAPEIEDALIEALDKDSATISYLAGFALSGMASEKALPKLMEILIEGDRFGEPRILAEILTLYQDRLIKELLTRFKDEDDDDLSVENPLVIALAELIKAEGAEIYPKVEKAKKPLALAKEILGA